MAKRRFQCWLSEGALAELERRAGAKDKRQAYLENWLIGSAVESAQRKIGPDVEKLLRSARPSLAPIPEKEADEILREAQRKLEARRAEPDPEREAEAIQARAGRKAARVERKAELRQAVAAALSEPTRVEVETPASAVARPHSLHSGVSPIPGCDVCAASAESFKGAK